eukprot:350723-Alexandrium_andersonii.AAC.1
MLPGAMQTSTFIPTPCFRDRAVHNSVHNCSAMPVPCERPTHGFHSPPMPWTNHRNNADAIRTTAR